jgi:hypothetical protein
MFTGVYLEGVAYRFDAPGAQHRLHQGPPPPGARSAEDSSDGGISAGKLAASLTAYLPHFCRLICREPGLILAGAFLGGSFLGSRAVLPELLDLDGTGARVLFAEIFEPFVFPEQPLQRGGNHVAHRTSLRVLSIGPEIAGDFRPEADLDLFVRLFVFDFD